MVTMKIRHKMINGGLHWNEIFFCYAISKIYSHSFEDDEKDVWSEKTCFFLSFAEYFKIVVY